MGASQSSEEPQTRRVVLENEDGNCKVRSINVPTSSLDQEEQDSNITISDELLKAMLLDDLKERGLPVKEKEEEEEEEWQLDNELENVLDMEEAILPQFSGPLITSEVLPLTDDVVSFILQPTYPDLPEPTSEPTASEPSEEDHVAEPSTITEDFAQSVAAVEEVAVLEEPLSVQPLSVQSVTEEGEEQPILSESEQEITPAVVEPEIVEQAVPVLTWTEELIESLPALPALTASPEEVFAVIDSDLEEVVVVEPEVIASEPVAEEPTPEVVAPAVPEPEIVLAPVPELVAPEPELVVIPEPEVVVIPEPELVAPEPTIVEPIPEPEIMIPEPEVVILEVPEPVVIPVPEPVTVPEPVVEPIIEPTEPNAEPTAEPIVSDEPTEVEPTAESGLFQKVMEFLTPAVEEDPVIVIDIGEPALEEVPAEVVVEEVPVEVVVEEVIAPAEVVVEEAVYEEAVYITEDRVSEALILKEIEDAAPEDQVRMIEEILAVQKEMEPVPAAWLEKELEAVSSAPSATPPTSPIPAPAAPPVAEASPVAAPIVAPEAAPVDPTTRLADSLFGHYKQQEVERVIVEAKLEGAKSQAMLDADIMSGILSSERSRWRAKFTVVEDGLQKRKADISAAHDKAVAMVTGSLNIPEEKDASCACVPNIIQCYANNPGKTLLCKELTETFSECAAKSLVTR